MAINPNIALGVQTPQLQMPDPNSGINALARVLQIKDMQQNQQMNALKMDEYQRGIREQDELKTALSQPGADPYNVLIGKGRVKDATEFAKGKAAAGKDAAETTQKEVETRAKVIAQYRDQLWNVQTPEQAAAWFQAQYADPVIGKFAASAEPLEKAVASIPQDPVAFKDWLQKAGLGMTQYIEKNKPTITTRNTGGTTDTIATEGLTGKTSVLNSVKNTQSPDNAASVAATIRGQNMTDARARESAANSRGQFIETTNGFVLADPKTGGVRPVTGPDGQPLKGKAADRQMTDAQAKANLFGSRMKESDRILNGLEGKYDPMAVNAKMAAAELPVVGGAAGYAGNLMLSTEGQQAEQAQRDFINAVLRRESGAVISPQEFSNGQKQYFPQPGDTKEVLDQKRRNRQLAIQGMEAEVPGGFRGAPQLTSPGSSGGSTGGWSIQRVN